MTISVESGHRLTGRVSFSAHASDFWRWRETTVCLYVQEAFEACSYGGFGRGPRTLTRWRLATPIDLARPDLRWLIDGPSVPSPDAAAPPVDDGVSG